MKSITQIKNRLQNEKIDSKYSPSHRQNIKVLKWVLEGEDLSTCEANSSAVLAEVRVYINERIKYYESKQDISHYHNTIYELKKISEHFR